MQVLKQKCRRKESGQFHSVPLCLCAFSLPFYLLFAFTPLCQAARRAIVVEELPSNKLIPVSESPSNDSTGLFVGINDFKEDKGLAQLDYAVNDAVEQAYVFVFELKLIPARNCILCLSGVPTTDPTRKQLELLLQEGVELAAASKSRILRSLRVTTLVPSSRENMTVVSFSTHGFENKQGVYLMPADGLRGSFLEDTGISSDTIKEALSQSKAGKKLLIMDACRARVDQQSRGSSANAMTDAFKNAFMSSTGFATVMSCGVGQFSYEDNEFAHGVFSNYLIQALRGQAEPDERGFITLGNVTQYVSDNVRRWVIRHREVEEENISSPWLAGPETARDIPLAIARKQFQDSTINLPANRDNVQQQLVPPPIAVSIPKPGDVITNSIGMKLVWIPPGEFMMGSPPSESKRDNDEGPVHKVKITQGFWMGQYEVTQDQYQAVMSNNPSHFKGDNLPADTISWNEATEFCRKLSQREGKTYRLPSEAEWEYACRAGTATPFYFGETIGSDQANYYSNDDDGNNSKGQYREQTVPVGSFKANAFGLFDMHGNVWEWCQDWYDSNYYSSSPVEDPQGPDIGSQRVSRGGSWVDGLLAFRSAIRNRNAPTVARVNLGFRVVLEASLLDHNKLSKPNINSDELQRIINQVDAAFKEIDSERESRLAAIPDKGRFAVVGVLKKSAIFTGEGSLRRYRIIDDSSKTVCYAQPTNKAVQEHCETFLERKVGLVGTIKPNPTIGGSVIVFKEIVLLE